MKQRCSICGTWFEAELERGACEKCAARPWEEPASWAARSITVLAQRIEELERRVTRVEACGCDCPE